MYSAPIPWVMLVVGEIVAVVSLHPKVCFLCVFFSTVELFSFEN